MASHKVGNAYVVLSAKFDKSWNSSISSKAVAVGNVIANGVSAAFGAIRNSLDAAISRVDTMNNFPRIMQNMGISSDAASASINRISDAIDGLPTALDTAVLGVERFTAKNGDINKSTDYFVALNDAILAGGASTELQSSAIEQLAQSYSKGKMDMMEWRSVQQAMPAQLNQIAKAMGMTTDELGEGLRKGEISMDEFMDTIVKLDKEGGDGLASFEEQARTATGGIGTALTNVQNRVNKAVGSIIDAIGQTNISGAINAFSSSFKGMAQPVIDFIESFKGAFRDGGFYAAIEPLVDLFGQVGDRVRETASNLGELFGNIMTVIGPSAISLFGNLFTAVFGSALTIINSVAKGLNWVFDKFDLMTLSWERQTSAIAASGKQLDYYTGVIEELAGKENLTTLEQVKLKQAVEEYNKITGDSVQVIDAQNGLLSKSTDEIKRNADAWLDNAYAQAYQQQVADIIADTADKQQKLAEAIDRRAVAEANLNAFKDDTRNDQAYRDELARLQDAYDDADREVREYTDAIAENDRKLEEATERTTAADSSLLAYIDSNATLTSMLKKVGVSSATFSNFLSSIGKSENDLAKMSPKVADGLARISKVGGGVGEATGKLFATMSENSKTAAESIMSAFAPVGNNVAKSFESGEPRIKASNNEILNSSKSTATGSMNAYNSVPSYIGGKFSEVQRRAAEQLAAVSSKASSSASSTGNAFNSVPGQIGSRLEDARNRASGSLGGISNSSRVSADNSVPPWNGLGDRIKRAVGEVRFPQPEVWWETRTLFGGVQFQMPHVVWHALGGFVDGATLIGAGEAGAEMILPQSGGLMDSFSENVTEHVSNADLIEWLDENLGPIISKSAPEATPREFGRMVRQYA